MIMLLQAKILSPSGECIAHQPRIGLKKMVDKNHLGALGVKEKDIPSLNLYQEKVVKLGWGYVLVVKRIK
ncbi:hypothetical protein DRN58_05835 [Thermococci archaeon]|nr:MAG: hypothetical protein DRN58_05835 [Thermococci archaeon]